MFKRLASNFDGGVTARVFVGRKAGRYISEFLDKFGNENISGCIVQGILITDCLPVEYKESLKKQCEQFKEIIPAFKDNEVYNWILPQHRSFIEANPGGKEWAVRQLQQIRDYLLS